MLADSLKTGRVSLKRVGRCLTVSMLLDLRPKSPELTGKVAENALVAADITVNKNKVPYDERSAFQTSGIRLGTAAMTTRGAKEDLMHLVASLIDEVLAKREKK